MTRRVKVTSDGTAVGTFVEVDGKPLYTVTRVDVQIVAGLPPIVTLTLDDVDLDIITPTICGAPHPVQATVRCEADPHGRGQSHAGQGHVWSDER